MTAICRNGHISKDTSYCDVCGAPVELVAEPPMTAVGGVGGGGAGRWIATVTADRAYFDLVAPQDTAFPEGVAPRVMPLDGDEILIGRHSKSRRIAPHLDLSGRHEDFGISHKHAWLERQPSGAYAVVDAGSSNGTTVNDSLERIPPHQRITLHDGDRIHLGFWTTITLTEAGPEGDAEPGLSASDVAWLVGATLADSSRLRQQSARRYEDAIERFQDVVDKARSEALPVGHLDDSAVFAVASPELAVRSALQLLITAGPAPGEQTEPHPGPPIRVAIHARRIEQWSAADSPTSRDAALSLARAGHAGQILISEAAVAAGLGDVLTADTHLESLGIHRLPNLSRPQHIYQLSHPGLQAGFPPLRVLDNAPNNLAEQATDFIGRQREVAQLIELLDASRLCSITGPGGVGKTRLAIQAGGRVLARYPQGVWIADLSGVTDGALVASTVIDALDIREGGAGTVAAPGLPEPRSAAGLLVDYLGSADALLILDNCEHVLDGCRDLVAELLRKCATLRIIVTSREPLHLVGEGVLKLEPLQLQRPWDSTAAGRVSDAVALFLNRAELHNPDREVTRPDLELAAQICRHVDGIPLAIELAAARTRELSWAQLAGLLVRSRPEAVTAGAGLQSSLNATIDWSYRLLSPREQVVFRRLAVFAGGFELNACRTVCSGSGIERFEIADLVNALVVKSLVEAEPEPAGTRYRLLEIARHFASERLAGDPDADAARHRHVEFFRRLAEQAEPELSGPDHARWFRALDNERANLLAAIANAQQDRSGDDERIAAALRQFWIVRGRLTEGCEVLDNVLAADPDRRDALRAKTLTERAMLASFAGDFVATSVFAQRAVDLAEANGSKAIEARARSLLGLVAVARADLPRAIELQREAVALCGELADPALTGFIRTNLANALTLQGDMPTARENYDEATRLRRAAGDEWGIVWSLFRSGTLATWEGRFPEAFTELTEALERARRIEFGQGILLAVLGLADACYVHVDYDAAEAGYLEALDTARELEEPTSACLALAGLANVAIARGDLAAAGTWLTEEEAVTAERTATTLAAVKESRAALASARRDDHTAEALHREALRLRRETCNSRAMTDQLERLALVASRLGNQQRAAIMLAAAGRRRAEMQLPVPHLRRSSLDQLVIRIADSVDDAVHAAWADGTDLTFDDVVSLALADEGPAAPAKRSALEAPAPTLVTSRSLAARFDSWLAELSATLERSWGPERGAQLFTRYSQALPAEYWMTRPPDRAAADLDLLDSAGDDIGVRMERSATEDAGFRTLTLVRREPVALADVLPVIENFGLRVLDERPYRIASGDSAEIWLYDLRLTRPQAMSAEEPVDNDRLFEQAFVEVWSARLENDQFNQLVLAAGLPPAEVALLRAYGRYQRLIANAFSQEHIQRTLASHPAIAGRFVELFRARFDPASEDGRERRCTELETALVAAIDEVPNLDDDRILRGYLALIQATLRTNYFQRRDGKSEVLSVKLDPSRIANLPLPRPVFEVYVYSPRLEGVHLRGGPIARGGIRWSDRPDDFRTEILGLMKAQMVKNTVIVPTGAKGGFVVRRPPADRDRLQDEGRACYRALLGGILDVTDNIVDGVVQPPADVVRYDGDDPYLVVAADKGTATFADAGNDVSAGYRFWLSDAFASGGSAGYDHKRMGITAKGAWESAKRHFASLGRDPERDELTVIGIGDMSGDVFGNGLQRSQTLKLIGAFDHRHIFIDPDPDPSVAFAERKRLYELPGSSWADYRPEALSAGGAVVSRQAKSIVLSAQAQAALGVDSATLTPDELVSAMLRAPVDLVYNGGIGTHARGSDESNADVGDKANDATRVCGSQLRCRVVVEGGNLGFTQQARVEFARNGGLINTDAIDNSAGVDCSDHEVNIKILLNGLCAAGELSSAERDELLREMADEVCTQVLADNYAQALALARSTARADALGALHQRYVESLERRGQIDRVVDGLPAAKEFAERLAQGRGLTCPELAVLMAHTKMALYVELLASDVPEDPAFGGRLFEYFPATLRARFPDALAAHPLRREIIATSLTNELVNRQELSFLFRVEDATEAPPTEVVKARAVVVQLLGADELWQNREAGSDPGYLAALDDVDAVIEDLVHSLLRGTAGRPIAVTETVASLREPLRALAAAGRDVLDPAEAGQFDAEIQNLARFGYRAAEVAAFCRTAPDPLGIAQLVVRSGERAAEVLAVHRSLVSTLQLGWLSEQVDALPHRSLMESLTRLSLKEAVETVHHSALDALLAKPSGAPAGDRVASWITGLGTSIRRPLHTLREVRELRSPSAATLGLVLNDFRAVITPPAR